MKLNTQNLKYDNAIRVSYPKDMYEQIRLQAHKKGISLQDFQRKAIEFYLNHLNFDYNEIKIVENGRKNKHSVGKRELIAFK
jgi:hypothetical protein